MSNLLFYIGVLLLLLWALGYFVFSVGAIIHILLFIALVSILLRFIRGSSN